MVWLLLFLAVEPRGANDFVDAVEINTFGDPPRTALIYRDDDGRIIDWRWLLTKDQIPVKISADRHLAVWEDQGRVRSVICRKVFMTRTKFDVELEERKIFDYSKRRKLRP